MKHQEKLFIITVDTEGDNLWTEINTSSVKTNNAFYIPRFQELCNKYEFYPVYLTNYEMVKSNDFTEYIKPKVKQGLCEVGIHIHAWNNPPFYELEDKYNGNPYLIEYPYDVMRDKFKVTYDLICEKIGVAPVSHRAGRWAMNDDYFKLLKEFKVGIDCSYTPGVSWKTSKGQTIVSGSDYSEMNVFPTMVNGIKEMPVSIFPIHFTDKGSFLHKIKVFIKGQHTWLRPSTSSFFEMKVLCDSLYKLNIPLEFMIHSSELMPGGSPYYKDEESVENLYTTLNKLFSYLKDKGFKGVLLKDLI